MRHRVKGRKFNRTSEHRRALMRNLASSLLKHKKITTTTEKAKELRKFVEPIITKAKNDSVAARRYISNDIKDRGVVKELFSDIVAKIGDRPGGYTRVVRLGQRKGDGAELSIIELVDYSGIVKPKSSKKGKGEEATVEKVEDKKQEKEESKKEEPVEEKKEKKEKKVTKPKSKKAPAKTKKAEAKDEKKEKKETKTKKAPAKKTTKPKKSDK